MSKTKKIELSPKQLEFLKRCNHRFNGKIGATRCGKTWLDTAILIPQRIIERKGKSGINIILGVSKGTIERNVLEPMRDFYGPHLVSEINSQNKATLFNETVYCIGAEKVSQVSKLRGAEFKYAYCDELVDFHEEVFQILKSRLSGEHSVCDFTGNPSHPDHFVKKFIESDADVYCQNWTIYDNPFLPQDFVSNLEIEYKDTVYFDRYILGMWKKAEGLIFANYESAIIEPIEQEYKEYYISIDYGIQNPFTMGLFGLGSDGVWYKIKEYHHSGRDSKEQKTDNDYYNDLIRFAGNLKIRHVIIDPSASSFVALIKKNRRFSVKKAKNDVLAGIARVNAVLSAGQLKIFNTCTETIKEFGMYIWDTKSGGDTPVKDHDHHCDNLRYFVLTNKIGLPKDSLLLRSR